MYSCMHFDDILIEKVRSVELHVHFCTFFLYIYTCTIERQREWRHVYYLLETSN